MEPEKQDNPENQINQNKNQKQKEYQINQNQKQNQIQKQTENQINQNKNQKQTDQKNQKEQRQKEQKEKEQKQKTPENPENPESTEKDEEDVLSAEDLKEFKLFTQRIGLVGITNILVSLSGIILVSILTKNLSVKEYGQLAVFIISVTLISNIITLGLPFSIVRFLPALEKNKIKREFFSVFIFVMTISGFILIFIFIIWKFIFNSYNLTNVKYYLHILIICSFIEGLNNLLLNYFRALQKMKRYAYLLLTNSYLLILLVFLFVNISKSVFYVLIGFLLTKIVLFIIMFLSIVKEEGPNTPLILDIKKYISFGLPLLPQNLARWAVDSSDRYIILVLLGSLYVGYYSPCYSVGSITLIIISPMIITLPPILSKLHDSGEYIKVKTILNASIKYYIFFATPFVAALSVSSKYIIEIITTPEIASHAGNITPIIAITYLIYGIYVIYFQIISLAKKTKIIGGLWILAATINIALNLILIPFIYLYGAALSTFVAFFIALILTRHHAGKYIKLEVNKLFVIKSVLSSVSIYLIIHNLLTENIIHNTILILTGFAAYIALMYFTRGIDKSDFVLAKQFIKL